MSRRNRKRWRPVQNSQRRERFLGKFVIHDTTFIVKLNLNITSCFQRETKAITRYARLHEIRLCKIEALLVWELRQTGYFRFENVFKIFFYFLKCHILFARLLSFFCPFVHCNYFFLTTTLFLCM